MILSPTLFLFFFFNDTATTEIYTLSLHDALPILASSPHTAGAISTLPATGGGSSARVSSTTAAPMLLPTRKRGVLGWRALDRKSTRLNSSHVRISYAVFCLKKKK